MCDPTIMAIASMASGIADVMGQASAQAKQKQAYDEWFAMQEKNRIEQQKKQEESRKLAEAARQQGVEAISAESQKAAQDREAARLSGYLTKAGGPLTQVDPAAAGPAPDTAGVNTSIADKFLLAGQQTGDQVFKSDLAAKLNKAASEARARIGALATASSFGPSRGGLDNFTADMFQKAAMTIDEANEFRRGNLAVYGIQQAVNPVTYTYTPGIRL